MTGARIVELDPLLGSDGATAMVELCERFGRYRTYAAEAVDSELGRVLPQRWDAIANYLRTGGRHRRVGATAAELASRTNYFREEYAYGERVLAPGIEPFWHHEGFVDAARLVHGLPVVEPAIVYANLLAPGQELTVHTDVPEFRGANRKTLPQWLCVAMHHSDLFADHRLHIATGVAWFHDSVGGEFVSWPDGPDAPPRVRPVRHDTAVVLDTDSVFHGVDPVGPADADLPLLTAGSTLEFAGDGTWSVRDASGTEVARHPWAALRFSVSWKAYCFADEHERRRWREHDDDLGPEVILDRFRADLRARGRLGGADPSLADLARNIVEEYVRFPAPTPASGAAISHTTVE